MAQRSTWQRQLIECEARLLAQLVERWSRDVAAGARVRADAVVRAAVERLRIER